MSSVTNQTEAVRSEKIEVGCTGDCGRSMKLDPRDPMARGWVCVECGMVGIRPNKPVVSR